MLLLFNLRTTKKALPVVVIFFQLSEQTKTYKRIKICKKNHDFKKSVRLKPRKNNPTQN